MSLGSDDAAAGHAPDALACAVSLAARPAVYFDGASNRRREVSVRCDQTLDIVEDAVVVASWPYDDLRTADGGQSALRIKCTSAPPLARLEIFDPAVQQEVRARAQLLNADRGSGKQTLRIVIWSLAAIASIVIVVAFGVPLVADRAAPLIPFAFERRVGDMADNQVRAIFGGKLCTSPEGDAAFAKLVETLRQASHIDRPLQTAVLASPIPNAFALPGGRIYLLNGLLQKAGSADELAGVIAHEMGHISHRDQMRMLIEQGGTGFLVGLLFGDFTGSAAVIFASRALTQASYTREAERNADDFAIKTMHALGRSPAPMGDLLFRITGAQAPNSISILASHPLTEERRALMRREDRPATGPEILTTAEWQALKAVCSPNAK